MPVGPFRVPSLGRMDSLDAVRRDICDCRQCPRLVEWREQVAVEKRAAYRDDEYWGKGVPGFGDPTADRKSTRLNSSH